VAQFPQRLGLDLSDAPAGDLEALSLSPPGDGPEAAAASTSEPPPPAGPDESSA
jgi:hypothetical protein